MTKPPLSGCHCMLLWTLGCWEGSAIPFTVIPHIIINIIQASPDSICEASAINIGGMIFSSLQQNLLVLILAFYCFFIINQWPICICMHTYLRKLLFFADTVTPYLVLVWLLCFLTFFCHHNKYS